MDAILWSILTYVFFIVSFLLGFVLIAHILLQKRPPSGTIAWLLVILLLPYAGVPLYLIFGGRKMQRHVNRKGRIGLTSDEQIPEDQASVLDRLLRSFNFPGAETGHCVEFCRTGTETYQAMERLLKNAQRSIYISIFIYQKDEVGRRILDILS